MTSEIATRIAVLDRRDPAQSPRPAWPQTSFAAALKLTSLSFGFARNRETVFQTARSRRAKVYFARSRKTARSLGPEAARSADRRLETLLRLAASAPRASFPAGNESAVFRCRLLLSWLLFLLRLKNKC